MDYDVIDFLVFLKDWATLWVPIGAAIWAIGAGARSINKHFKAEIEASGEKLQKNLDRISKDFREFRAEIKAEMNERMDRMDAEARESRQRREEDKREYQLEIKEIIQRSDRKHEEANERYERNFEKHDAEWKDLQGKFHLVDKTVALMEKNHE